MEQITIKDIARICGCGISTVSRALNNHPDINPETKQRIMEVVAEYDFVPNNSARNLKITESLTIAILVKGMTNPFFTKMIKIMEEEIEKNHYSMEIRHVDEETDEVETAIELVKEKKLKGIIFLGGYFNHSPEKLKRIGVPFVLSTISVVGEYDGSHSSVSVDDMAESYKMVDYLIKQGHEKIAILTAPEADASIGRLRTEGYLKALADHKISVDKKYIRRPKEAEEIYSMENGYKAMKKMLEENLDMTAVYAISDTLAIGACKALKEAGRKIPEDISVAGFDGIEMGYYVSPGITTIRQPIEEMATETVKQLFDVINNGARHEKKVFEAELVVRDSVAKIN